MTAAFGGNPGPKSTDTKQLQAINSRNVSYANKDFVKNIAWLNSSVDTLSQWSQKLQAGVDDANENVFEQIQGFAADLFVLFAGMDPTGIDIGDLKYIIQGLGAMFGINPGTPFPLNIFNAVEHMFMTYMVPLEQFTDVIFDAIMAWAADFGLSPEFLESLTELKDAIEALGHTFSDIFSSIGQLLDIFGGGILDFGPLGSFWDALLSLLEGINTSALKPVISMLADLGVPFINALTAIINAGNAFLSPLSMISGSQIATLGDNICPPVSNNTTQWAVGSNSATGWIYDEDTASFTTLGNGGSKRMTTQTILPCQAGKKFRVKASLKWSGIPSTALGFGMSLVWFNGQTEVSQTNVNIPSGHGSSGGFSDLNPVDITVPINVDGFKIAVYVNGSIASGQVWVKAPSVQLYGQISQNLIEGLIDTLAGFLDFGNITKGLFGIDGGDENIFTMLGTNLMKFLGLPNFNVTDFNPIEDAKKMIQRVLTPAGALSSWTQIPQHLFGGLNFGNLTTLPGISGKVSNLLPDPEFRDPNFISGNEAWFHDSTKTHGTTAGDGSVRTTGGGIVRQLLGVPIKTAPDQATDLSAWCWWSGVVASAGDSIALVATPYSDDDARVMISDPSNRVVSVIQTPGANSASFSGTDPKNNNRPFTKDTNNWVRLQGSYKAPPGTKFVRLTFEVQSNVTAGDIWFSSCVHSLSKGLIDASLLSNVENLTQLPLKVLQGLEGLLDMGGTLQHMLDGLGSAFSSDGGVEGINFSNLFTLAQESTMKALDAFQQAIFNSNILGIRTNKKTSSGLNNTSEAMFDIGHFSSAGSMTTTSLAANTGISQMYRVSEDSKKGFFEFLASGTSLSNIYVNIYSIDLTTFARTTLWKSGDISNLITSSLQYIRALVPGANQPQLTASSMVMLEIVNNGSNALTLVTKNTGIPNHPSEMPKNFGGTRSLSATGGAQPNSLTDSQITYSGVIPYINLGILDVPTDYHPPLLTPFLTNAINTGATYTYNIPSWIKTGDKIVLVGVGGGGGGADSATFVTGNGGDAGHWTDVTLTYGVDIPATVTQLTIVVGKGGSRGGYNNGQNGSSTIISYTISGVTTNLLVATGGTGGQAFNSQQLTGLGAGRHDYAGNSFFGGGNVSGSQNGSIPGGAGGGGLPFTTAGYAADGAAWVLAKQAA